MTRRRGGRREAGGLVARGTELERTVSRSARGGEGLAHVAVVGHRLRKNQHLGQGAVAGGRVKKRDVLGERLGGLEVFRHHSQTGAGCGYASRR